MPSLYIFPWKVSQHNVSPAKPSFFFLSEVFDWVQVTLVSADAELNEGGVLQRGAKKPSTPPWQPQADTQQKGHRIATSQEPLLWQP